MVLRCNEHFPIIHRWRGEVRAGISNEVAEDMLFQVCFGMGSRVTSEPIETRQQRPAGITVPTVHAAIATPPRSWVRLRWGHLVDQVTQTPDRNFIDRHADLNVR